MPERPTIAKERPLPHLDTYRCANCQHEAPVDEMREARRLFERMEDGDTYTSKECPLCGALAFPVDDEPAADPAGILPGLAAPSRFADSLRHARDALGALLRR